MECSNICPPVYIFAGVVLPLIIGLLVIVILKFKSKASDKKVFLNNLLFYLLLIILAYFLLNWLCENRYFATSNLIAFLPFLAYIYTGYMFVKSPDCMKAVNSIFSKCLKF
jgi:ABC-type transport system involved in cytochrome c biogenesis permease subunit